MTTLRAIITEANRDLGILGEAEEAPAEMAQRGLRLLRGLIAEAVGLTGGPWREIDADAAYLAGEDERVRITGQIAVSLPVSIEAGTGRGSLLPADGDTRRPPRPWARLQVTGARQETWIHAADLGVWMRADGLELTDQSPLGPSADDGLTAALAVRINRGRGPLDADVARTAAQFRLRLASGRERRRDPAAGETW